MFLNVFFLILCFLSNLIVSSMLLDDDLQNNFCVKINKELLDKQYAYVVNFPETDIYSDKDYCIKFFIENTKDSINLQGICAKALNIRLNEYFNLQSDEVQIVLKRTNDLNVFHENDGIKFVSGTKVISPSNCLVFFKSNTRQYQLCKDMLKILRKKKNVYR